MDAIGYIIEVYPDHAYEVEFCDTNGVTVAQIVAQQDELEWDEEQQNALREGRQSEDPIAELEHELAVAAEELKESRVEVCRNMGQQLQTLLQSTARPLTRHSLLALGDVGTDVYVTGPLPLQQIKHIYGVRASINERNGSPIEGFDDLLAGLGALSDEGVTLHSIETPCQIYKVFMDAACTMLAGVLRIPRRAGQ